MSTNNDTTHIKKAKSRDDVTRESFRPKMYIDAFALAPPAKPGFIRKGVCVNWSHMPRNYQDHLDAGFEVVYGTEQFKDDRTFAPDGNQSESSVMESPIMKTTSTGDHLLLMEISEEKLKSHLINKNDAIAKKYKQTVGYKGRAKDGTIIVNGGEDLFDK